MGSTVRDALLWAQGLLDPDEVDVCRIEIDRLLASVLNVRRHDLYLDPGRDLSDEEKERFHFLWSERLSGRPLQHLLGETEFMSLPFRVAPGVFIPRPETECLVEKVIDLAPQGHSTWVDIGTGAGVVAVALAVGLPSATVIASDICGDALRLARANAILNGVADRVRFVRANGLTSFRHTGRVDGIVSNPPYIAEVEMEHLPAEVRNHDPLPALHGGWDGLDLIRELVSAAPGILKPGGILAMEIGETQGDAVVSLLRAGSFWRSTEIVNDLTDRPRVVVASLDYS
ncbi:MAG: peptide chain release factor N(5)-glutamine methyltransferase [Candidatus Eisenbacteria sp.]|nr:peptide chain release factor N(5)-glutamine methyltransferase [Candidatus Eisenbacteria bacterium]